MSITFMNQETNSRTLAANSALLYSSLYLGYIWTLKSDVTVR